MANSNSLCETKQERSKSRFLWIWLGALLVVTAAAPAQTTTGSIYGTVTDPGGAVIPKAVVTATNVENGQVQEAVTNASGEYVFQALNPGNYSVSTQVAGFKRETQRGLALSSNQNIHAVFALEVASGTESITIEAATTLVDTRESQIAETIDQRRIEELPLNGRDAYDLVTLVPGVTKYTVDTATGTRAGVLFSVNGLPTNASSYYLDGAYDTTFFSNGGNLLPNPDALQEFRIITSNFDAEFGRNPGGVINTITRSGTAKYHGMAYEYLRNNIFNAKNYFLTSVNPIKQNQFGGNFGGPVPLLPTGKVFFFTSVEKLISHTAANVASTAITTATPLERTGDFSLSVSKPTKLPTGTNCGTTALPKICAAALDPVAQKLLTFVPVEDPSGTFTSQQTANANLQTIQGLGRVDYQLSAAHQVEAMFFAVRGSNIQPTIGPNRIVSYAGMSNTENVDNVVLGDTWTLSARTVNSLRGFYTQNRYIIANTYTNHFLPDLGSNAVEGNVPSGLTSISATPNFVVTGYWTMGTNTNGPSDVSQLSFGLVDTENLTRGRHQIKVGGAYIWNKYAETGGNQSNGIFTFTGGTSGNALADFLLGSANSLTQTSAVRHRTHSYDPSLFAQDDWQITPRLNLNLGVRWEIFAPFIGDNTSGTFVPGAQSSIFPTAPIGLLYEGDPGIAPGVWNAPLTSFAPRVGFGYDLFGGGRTSLRGGYGIFYSYQGEAQSSNLTQSPYTLTVTQSKTPGLVNPYGVGLDPFPYIASKTAPRFVSGSTIAGTSPGGGAIPYVYEYNLTVEQQLSSQFALRIGYVGNSARKFHLIHDINAPAYIPGAATTTAAINARRPYQPTPATFTYAAINVNASVGDFSYNALQTSLRGRIGHNLTLQSSYVWSKALSYEGVPVNGADIRTDFGPATTDLRDVFTASALYSLPAVNLFGAFGKIALSDWQINGVASLQSGSPFVVTSGVDTNLDGVANDRVDIVGNPYSSAFNRAQRIKGFLNPSAFAVPTGPYGDEQNDSLVGPRNIVTNVSLFKMFPIYENLHLQFRAEAFNALNNVNLGTPVANLTTLNANAAKGASQISSAGDARVLQFVLKLIF